jgi:hypothetical protein
LFKPAVRVPYAWIAATPSLRKRCKKIKGSAGRKRLRLIAERQCDEKVIDSKATYMQVCIPSPVLPTTLSSESDDDEFVDARVRMASWAATILSVLTKFVVHRSSSSLAAPPASMAVRPLEETRQSAYCCTGCSLRAETLSSIVKPTIGGVGGFETVRNTETAGTPIFFGETTPFP